jgi:hypothetical protein
LSCRRCCFSSSSSSSSSSSAAAAAAHLLFSSRIVHIESFFSENKQKEDNKNSQLTTLDF